MKNRMNFIPKSLNQPKEYRIYFGHYCGVYVANNGIEYHLQIFGNVAIDRVDGIDILRQDSDGRRGVSKNLFKTVKSAIEYLDLHFEENNLN